MKKILLLIRVLSVMMCSVMLTSGVQSYGPVLFSEDQYGYVTVRWDRVPDDLRYTVKVSGAIMEEHEIGRDNICRLSQRLRKGDCISVRIYAVGYGYNMGLIAEGSYKVGYEGLPPGTGLCPKKLGTVSSRFSYYYDAQQHQWAVMVYMNQTPADGADNLKHSSFRIYILGENGVTITHSYCPYGSGYVYLTNPRGSYFVKIVADGCEGGGTTDGHYLTGDFYITRELPDEAGITLTEHNE